MLAYSTTYLSTLPVLPLVQILHCSQYAPQYCIKSHVCTSHISLQELLTTVAEWQWYFIISLGVGAT